ncbi:MAG: type II toxin-antitoxin system VapC family toxin [Deltaproteobacteria bacterium]|jgi:tRNA(fMet)-specific endonuclease VapC|nr:type II toxin-antitoxin system VapC family toxin [Deltaproteobacteria bacterium]
MRILLDTNICIYLIKNNPPEIRKYFYQYSPGDIAIASISVAELRYGVEKSTAKEKNARALEAFLLPLEILSFDDKAAFAYGRIRAYLEQQGESIGGMDMLIAAQALSCNCRVITHNLKEFRRIPGLQCATWVE